MSNTRERLPAEVLDMLWHQVFEMGEGRKEALERIRNEALKKKDEE